MNVRVLGLGNVLMSDDGFGPYVVRVLEAFYQFSEGVQLVDVGAAQVDLAPFLLDASAVILVDTVKVPGVPGDIRVFGREDILRRPGRGEAPAHDPALREALLSLSAAGLAPSQLKMVGVIPDWIATGMKLSRAVKEAVAPAIGLIVTELERLGAGPRLRPVARRPETWWEQTRSAAAPWSRERGN